MKKVRTANINASQYVDSKTPFKGSNTFAEYENGVYMVYSYGYHFPIYAYKNGKWFSNKQKVSVTTSKHQSQLKPFYGVDYWLNTADMKKLPYESELKVLLKSE